MRLGQTCDNLISNAIKLTPRGGAVTVALNDSSPINESPEADQPNAVITVTDTGMSVTSVEGAGTCFTMTLPLLLPVKVEV